ncbi:MAG: hypothetical protein HUN05_16750 [Desulfobacter sp.]|nr:MAG: hypothetical protein HUN05_16750 [Desulfobacter sp.]
MKRFKSKITAAQTQMDQTYLFRMGLQLMIIMVKAELEGYPVGKYRKKAVLENAAWIHKKVLLQKIFPGQRDRSGVKFTQHKKTDFRRILSALKFLPS